MPPTRSEKKKPPTFNRFPPSRAKALKQAWVEKARIKSKWNAEKRKMGLVNPVHVQDDDHDTTDAVAEQQHVTENEMQNNTPSAFKLKKSHVNSRPQKLKGSIAKVADSQTSHIGKDISSSPSADLRELTRKAYSRESLHTYKSDPLKRRLQDGRKSGGKGQPNMKLRMNVTLEKIKRDYS
ncbi:hypothetical protein L218DRAFT_998247 [Marasmius fiardii PR-910]|nr:hypothetical protein L218DRAFT_998247 [Marasmius fiardii PR-910]